MFGRSGSVRHVTHMVARASGDCYKSDFTRQTRTSRLTESKTVQCAEHTGHCKLNTRTTSIQYDRARSLSNVGRSHHDPCCGIPTELGRVLTPGFTEALAQARVGKELPERLGQCGQISFLH